MSYSSIKGKVGSHEISWRALPHGVEGQLHADLPSGEILTVRWRRDRDGIWIELPEGVTGYDIQAEVTEDGRTSYQMSQRGTPLSWSELSFVRAGEEGPGAGASSARKNVRVRAQMPGKIIRVHVEAGAHVEKDQPLIVMEAMKMENEIRAPQAGRVTQMKVTEGQAVETGAELCLIEP